MRTIAGLAPPAILMRLAVFAAAWWAVTEGSAASLAIGVPAVLGALLLSMRLRPSQVIRPAGLLRFLPMFLWRSLAGGVDVAARALAPQLPLKPTLVEYRTSLKAGLPRVTFANVISLLPGTLSADLNDDVLCLHVLFDAAADPQELRRLEAAVAGLFG